MLLYGLELFLEVLSDLLVLSHLGNCTLVPLDELLVECLYLPYDLLSRLYLLFSLVNFPCHLLDFPLLNPHPLDSFLIYPQQLFHLMIDLLFHLHFLLVIPLDCRLIVLFFLFQQSLEFSDLFCE